MKGRRAFFCLLGLVLLFSQAFSQTAPRIAVTERDYDNIQSVLDAMGSYFAYTNITNANLADPGFDLGQFDVIFVNCSGSNSSYAAAAASRLRNWVNSGGYLYASDWAYEYITAAFPGYITFPASPKIGNSQIITANVEDAGLRSYLGASQIPITYDLGGWVVINSLASSVKTYLSGTFTTSSASLAKGINGPQVRLAENPEGGLQATRTGPLMVSFAYGSGGVFYTTFHHHAQSTTDQQIIRYLVLRPVADDLLTQAKGKLPAGATITAEIIGTASLGITVRYEVPSDAAYSLDIVLNWLSGTLRLAVYRPDGTLTNTWESSSPPLIKSITNAEAGTWVFCVTGISLSYNNIPTVLIIAKRQGSDHMTLLDPVNGKTKIGNAIWFCWGKFIGATGYDIEVDEQNNFSSPFADKTTADTTILITGMAYGQSYYWRVRPRDGTKSGEWSETHSFTTMLRPPLVINEPANYVMTYLEKGDQFYCDRGMKVTAISTFLRGLVTIKTFNNDKFNTNAIMLSCTLEKAATVYVAWDQRHVDTLPAWLRNGFEKTDLTLTTDNTDMVYFVLYKKAYPAGAVIFGGPRVDGGYTRSNYLVMVDFPALLLDPVANKVGTGSSVWLHWALKSSATAYRAQVATDSLFAAPVFSQEVSGSDRCLASGLAWGWSYFWRVGARLSSGAIEWSEARKFTVMAEPPVSLAAPAGAVLYRFQPGDEYLTDREYTLLQMPEAMENMLGAKLPGEDKINTLSSYLTFSLGSACKVYVAYDHRGTALPAWLSSRFTLQGGELRLSDELGSPYYIYAADFTPGTYSLGGNLASGAMGARSNYFVLFKPVVSALTLTYQQIESGAFPTVTSYVSVTDNAGTPIAGLTAAHFTVKENGILQTPITVTALSGTAVPISVALVLDCSGSMAGQPLNDAKAGANLFVDHLSAADKAAVISFESSVTLHQSFTSNKLLLHAAINALASGNSTALYDGIREAVNQTNTQSGRKAIVVLSDGKENASADTSLAHCIDAARTAGLPVYTIGLAVNAASEQELRRIANETGGRYYGAATSANLLEIYQLISMQLQNQYAITHTSGTPAFDCTARTVEISVNDQGSTDSKSRIYQAPCDTGQPIGPVVAASSLNACMDFWMDIVAGSSTAPVGNLFGVSFVLNFSPAAYLDVVTPAGSAIVPGSFLGSDVVLFQNVDEGAGSISAGVSRKAGAAGVSGYGSVLRIHFRVACNAPEMTPLNFTLSSIRAIDVNGATIQLAGRSLTLLVANQLLVWPGDADNDGDVDEADILPIGLYFGKTGPSRPGAPDLSWKAQPCPAPWTPEQAAYADCDGNGVIDQGDVLGIGLNWHKTHAAALAASLALEPAPAASSRIFPLADSAAAPGQLIYMAVKVEEVQDLFGLAFKLTWDDTEHVEIVGAKLGSFLGEDILAIEPQIDTTLHQVSVGMTRKAGQTGVSDSGRVLYVRLKISPETPFNSRLIFRVIHVKANDAEGNPIYLDTRSDTIRVNMAFTAAGDRSPQQPDCFDLWQNYPNPFNPATLITFQVATPVVVDLVIFNAAGQRVRSLAHALHAPGVYRARWEGDNDTGEAVSPGLYICRMQAGRFTRSIKLIYLK